MSEVKEEHKHKGAKQHHSKMAAAEPFDPFSFEEDDANDDQYTYESSLPPESTLFAQTVGTLSRGETASMSYVTDDTSRQQSQQQHPKSLPPKMTVKLSLHEEVSSSAVMEGGDTKNGGASSSQLFVEGKVVVSEDIHARVVRTSVHVSLHPG